MDDTSGGPVVIFGGRSEIGTELAQRLAPGATVVLAARGADRLSEQVAAVEKAGAATVDVREFDADDLASHAALVASIVADHGPIGTAVLAFGVLGDQARAEKDPAHAAAVLHTDFVAQASLLTVLADTMRSAGSGAIVVFSSVAGVRVRRANYVYGSAKAGLDGFCSGLADALHGSGVRLLLVRPGIRHRADDRGHEAGAHVEHAAAGRRGHGQGAGQGPAHGVGAVDAAAASSSGCGCCRSSCGGGCRDELSCEEQGTPVIIVVGVGADGMAGLAPTARGRIAPGHSDLRVRAGNSSLLDDSVRGERRVWPSPMLPALHTLLDGVEGDVHVVASGDPLLHGSGQHA